MSDDDANKVLEVEAARLGELIEALQARALEGDHAAIDRLVKLAKERARMVRQIATAPAPAPAEAVKAGKPLSERHRRFVEAFMGSAAGNAAAAAREAGYKGTRETVERTATRLTQHPAVRAAIEERQRGDPRVADREERQRFWSSIMRGEPQKQLVGERVLETVPTLRDRLLAAQHLGKSNGDFFERVKHEGHIGHEIVVVELPDNARGDR